MPTCPAHNALSRRFFLGASASGLLGMGLAGLVAKKVEAGVPVGLLPSEPLEIGHQPQFLLDLHVVDCTWGLRPKGDPPRRVFHQPAKHPANPVLVGDGASWLWAQREGGNGPIRMWYQANLPYTGRDASYATAIAYAQSDDGIHWEKPPLDLFATVELAQQGRQGLRLPRNTVLFPTLLAPKVTGCECGSPTILDVPEKDRRGYRYVMFYKVRGAPLNALRLIGSHDGIHWDPQSDLAISRLGSDHPNAIVYDPHRDEYVMFCRAKHIYRAPGQDKEMLNCGESRRGIARMTSKQLWTEWTADPQTILVPDEIDEQTDFHYFMAMPVFYHASIYWGLLEPFRWNDYVYSELAWSRDGIQFHRLPGRSKLIEYGPDGSWDDTLIFACPRWVDVGDEWWLYYSGWDGPHEDTPRKGRQRSGAVGVVTLRKEGIVSIHGPKEGGVVCTRSIRWPGGSLLVNADASGGELSVRISDSRRRPIEGFDYPDCEPFLGDSVRHEVRWQGRGLEALKDRVIRIEFCLKGADLYTFLASA